MDYFVNILIMNILDYGFGIRAIDSGYERVNLAAIHFIAEGDVIAIVDTAVNASVARIVDAVKAQGYSLEQVAYLLLTPIHLDHAGGAGQLMQLCRNARLVVHPRGVRHMADPTKLWQAVTAVYGEHDATRLYGTIPPIDVNRIFAAEDGFRLDFGSRVLTFIDTPGHAKHHVSIHDSLSNRLFAGDTFGLSYRELDHAGHAFVIPTSSPTQFEPDAAHRSIDRIIAYRPDAVYMTHFSEVREIPHHAERMHFLIDEYAAAAHANAHLGNERETAIRQALNDLVLREARQQGVAVTDAMLFDVLDLDLRLNAQGLVSWLDQGAPRG